MQINADEHRIHPGPTRDRRAAIVGQASSLPSKPIRYSRKMPDKRDQKPVPCDRVVDPRRQPFTPVTSRGDLVHLHKEGCTYFVTFCLRDAARRRAADRLSASDDRVPETAALRSEPEVDHGTCVLRDPEIATIVERAILHFQRVRDNVHAWVIMPNHVHVIVTPLPGRSLAEILHSWKSFTSNRINRRLQRTGRLWEEESFDNAIRDDGALVRFAEYIDQNPVTAGLCAKPEAWPFGSARFR